MEDYRTILFTVVANTYALTKNKYAMGLEIPTRTFWDMRDKVRLLKIFLNQLYRLKPEWSVKPTYYRGNTIGYGVATISDFLIYLTDCFSEYV